MGGASDAAVHAGPAPVTASGTRAAHETGKTFDIATTRRKPVVFEEDDDLDIPEFLK